jgi:hypothetical protein
MKYFIISSLKTPIMRYTLSLITFFILTSSLLAQNVYEIFITSFADARELKEVNFELYSDGEKIVEQLSKNGTFQFVIMENDKAYRLKAYKEGLIQKVIHFNSPDYPFINEYEIQEIDVEFHESNSPEDEAEIGALRWSSIAHVFNIVAVDSTEEFVKQNYAQSEKTLGNIYIKAIDYGDVLLAIRQPKYALMQFEIALLAKPDDEYAMKKIEEINRMESEVPKKSIGFDKEMMDKINKGEISVVSNALQDDGIIYSVQLGAFSQEIKQSDFQDIPDFNMIPYPDYTRVFSGDFKDVNLAIQRKNEMVKKGYKDAWIVQMKGNKRIGF